MELKNKTQNTSRLMKYTGLSFALFLLLICLPTIVGCGGGASPGLSQVGVELPALERAPEDSNGVTPFTEESSGNAD